MNPGSRLRSYLALLMWVSSEDGSLLNIVRMCAYIAVAYSDDGYFIEAHTK
jgi:hypothetical protein